MVKSSTLNSKVEFRHHYLSLRNSQNQIINYFRSRKISHKLTNLKIIKNSNVIAVYYALEKEVNLTRFIKRALADNKIILIPRMEKQKIVFHQIMSTNFPFKIWKGIKVPHKKLPIYHLDEIDSIIIPGVAFDRAGNRIGFGAGFYDRYLANNKTTKMIGVAFDFQISKITLPHQKHDVLINYIMTEKELIKAG